MAMVGIRHAVCALFLGVCVPRYRHGCLCSVARCLCTERLPVYAQVELQLQVELFADMRRWARFSSERHMKGTIFGSGCPRTDTHTRAHKRTHKRINFSLPSRLIIMDGKIRLLLI